MGAWQCGVLCSTISDTRAAGGISVFRTEQGGWPVLALASSIIIDSARWPVQRLAAVLWVPIALLLAPHAARAEDGYDLWLRYRPVETAWMAPYRSAATALVGEADSATLRAAQAELQRALAGLLGRAPPAARTVTRDGAILFGTPRSSPLIARLGLELASTATEGYLIRSVSIDGHRTIVIAAHEDIGVLYGVFGFLRLLQTRQSLQHLDLASAPHEQLRLLNHWDNLDETVERGYAGASIWDWQKLPDYLDPRYADYARACASIGINGTVLNSVNADALSLTTRYLRKAAALAQLFRPYGLRVYLSARFTAPIEIGGLKTADPLDPAVRAWWAQKADEIYQFIPDFGGWLIKANSEGQPGPQDYGRSHADGANLLADALAPHGGLVMWRAFVYSQDQPEDRAKQAYTEFKPLDGTFRDNVLLQVKYGPIDFQPREPFHPLFGAMPHTPLMLELQLTKEYLGFATHLVYLGPLWEETLDSDTYAQGRGSTVRSVIDGSLYGMRRTGIAGVANIGADRNWTGSEFDQANWYAFGRLAWDPGLKSEAIAREWVSMSFSSDPALVTPVVAMMMGSREAVVNYMTPLGLHHQMARDSHYGPGPWVTGGPRAEQTSVYYNRADSQGIGFDRTRSGSDAVSQYAPEPAAQFNSLEHTPENLLLWFHHVPWDYPMASGRPLWDELVRHYTQGVQSVSDMRRTWAGLAAFVDAERYARVAAFLAIQEQEASWWRDASIAYFQSLSHRPLPEGFAPPAHTLQYYEALCVPNVPGIPNTESSKCPPKPR
jgi:alpha-glucuronidase